MTEDAANTIAFLLVAAAFLQIVMIVKFFQATSDLSRMRTMVEALLTGPRNCDFCRGTIDPEATVCRYCGRDVDPWFWHDDKWWTQADGQWSYRRYGEWQEAGDDDSIPETLDE
jgi:hypothetical protein